MLDKLLYCCSAAAPLLPLAAPQVIERISAGLPNPSPAAAVFVGGLPTADDEKRLRR
jgi:hypothetical protein